jgi:hypothetical protein
MKRISESTKTLLMFIGALLFVIGFYISIGLKRPEKCEYTLTYQIHYPNSNIIKTTTFRGGNDMYYLLNSNRGTNYLKVQESGFFLQGNNKHIISTSAPIEVISFTKKSINHYNEK